MVHLALAFIAVEIFKKLEVVNVPVSKRIVKTPNPQSFVYKDGKIYYCRKCGQILKPDDFYASGDTLLDHNGKMSICKSCIQRIFQNEYIMSGKNLAMATLNTCRIINLEFDEKALQTAKDIVEKTNVSFETGFFGHYRNILWRGKRPKNKDERYLIFVEPETLDVTLLTDNEEVEHDVKEFWGDNYTPEEYEILEKEFWSWIPRFDVVNKEEESLIKMLCELRLDMRNLRLKNKPLDNTIKNYNAVMNQLGITPSRVDEANKTGDTFSEFIRRIEEEEPAEYYKDKKLFADYDNIGQYFEDFVSRPIRNFFGKGAPDFYVEDDGEGGHGGDLMSEVRADNSQIDDEGITDGL